MSNTVCLKVNDGNDRRKPVLVSTGVFCELSPLRLLTEWYNTATW